MLENIERWLEEEMKDKDFRDSHFKLLAFVLYAALILSCQDHSSVKLGWERLEDKVKYYGDLAMDSTVLLQLLEDAPEANAVREHLDRLLTKYFENKPQEKRNEVSTEHKQSTETSS